MDCTPVDFDPDSCLDIMTSMLKRLQVEQSTGGGMGESSEGGGGGG